MLYLLLTILLNVIVFALFKLFPKFGIDNLQAIVVNYATCVVTGCVFLGQVPFTISNTSQPWFYWALLMGTMFISIFNLIAYSIKKTGLTVSTFANKISLVIPVLFSFWLYNEDATFGKIAGVIIAFPAVYFTTKTKERIEDKNYWLPFLLFISSGLLDTLVKYVEHHFLEDSGVQSIYLINMFAAAALLGAFILCWLKMTGKIVWSYKSLIAGIVLGVPNYFSIYFFVKLLNSDFLQSSAAIPVNNIAIVLVSTIVAIFFFREKITWLRIVGLILSVISILLIIYADVKN